MEEFYLELNKRSNSLSIAFQFLIASSALWKLVVSNLKDSKAFLQITEITVEEMLKICLLYIYMKCSDASLF